MFAGIELTIFKLFAACQGGSFLGFPTWYKYLGSQTPPPESAIPITASQPTSSQVGSQCVPVINGINDFWLIAAAIIEILLRLGAIVALAFIVVGGFRYMTSQGEPNKTEQARNTVLNALYGLGMCIVATAAITFIAGRFRNA